MSELPKVAIPSLGSLLLELRFSGQTISRGTGFVVQTRAGPALITARHNVTGRHHDTGALLSTKTGAIPNEVFIYHHVRGGHGLWAGKLETLRLENGEPRWIEHP